MSQNTLNYSKVTAIVKKKVDGAEFKKKIRRITLINTDLKRLVLILLLAL